MLNQFTLLIGRVKRIYENSIDLAVSRPYKNAEGIYENDMIPVKVPETIMSNSRDLIKIDSIIGIKGHIETGQYLDSIDIVCEKISILKD